MFIDSDLRWNSHVDYIYKKARKKLYSLRTLRRDGVDQASMLKVYTSSVRSLLEYAVPVWQSIPGYLSDKRVYVQNEGLKPPSSSSSTNTPRQYLRLHPKAQIRSAVLLQERYYLQNEAHRRLFHF